MATKTTIFPKQFVEGLLAQALMSINHSFEQLVLGTDMKKVESAKATWAIALGEVSKVLDCLAPYQDQALTPKHWMVRDVFKHMRERLEATKTIGEAKTVGHSSAKQFARDLVDFMGTVHKIMRDRSTDEERRMHMGVFVGDVIEIDPVRAIH